MNKTWWKNAVIYQIYPRSFCDSNNDGIGDLQGIISKLDYLQNLGINVIWLSPVYKSPMKDNGYDISDYQDIDPLFGTMEDMDVLIKEADKREIKILMDLVINHTSDQHVWFQEAIRGKDNPYRDYYIWREKPSDIGGTFGGSAWEYDEKSNEYYFHLFAKEQPDLNWENPKILEEMKRMINFWLDKGVGGFRLDVIDLIGKEVDKNILGNGPKLHPLLKELNQTTWGNYPSLTVGETWGATPQIGELYSDPAREELSMIFQFEHITSDWGELGKWKPTPFNLVTLKKIFSKWQTELKNGWNSLFWNNHDLARVVSRWGNDKEYRVESAKMLACVLHFLKGTPYIYQGEEIGMTNVKFDSLEDYNDVEIHGFYHDYVIKDKLMTHDEFMEGVYQSGRDNARTPMQWNNTKNAGFTQSTPWLQVNPNYLDINTEKALEDKNSVFYTYQKLIQFRKDPVIGNIILNGSYEDIDLNNKDLFMYKRTLDENELIIIANFTEKELPNPIKGNSILYSNYETNIDTLKPYEVIVYKK